VGFWQRHAEVISEDGSAITDAWEASAEGREWWHDFDPSHLKAD
jgi:hypothetical protein